MKDTAPLSAELGELTVRVSHILRRRSRQLPLAPHQHRALGVISHGPLRPGQLADALRITPRAATAVVDALVAENLVATGPDPQDRRAKVVSITAAGRKYLAATRAKRAEISQELFGALSPREQQELARLLRHIIADAEATDHPGHHPGHRHGCGDHPDHRHGRGDHHDDYPDHRLGHGGPGARASKPGASRS
ncbi:winged helix-turn-helix transcriptional regulator [Corynebacterium lizhenjunii]|uniref:Winged helix-turn-helix transcriptional regulator n=1 Tax=Corynebacterium lizhenjunii TaxID=2709394 RepID=A0A7T0KET9_9CORY|nr:MarR family winged helix-turn-helix transcriptional regulator [Corynebacterium lizhenjunii]QPK78985.1 winged helix-turn-helix transcriptional regulator [Corynebacterium lizhenjunii]